jgi:hypothetical protein
VVSVGNVSKYDNVRPSSNSVSFLTFLAPGSGFQAEMQGDGIYSSVPGNGFEKFEGTSMAAPHVAGAFALLRALDPTSSVDDNIALLQQTGVSRTDPKNGQVTPRIDVAAALVEKFRNDAFEDIALLKGGPDGVDDYRMIMVAGPTDTAAGGLALTKHEDEADDYWLDHWSSGRTVGITSISDINGDGAPDIAYLKGGKLGVEDYRTIFVAGPSSASSGEQGLAIEEGAADDYWLDHWSPGRTVGMTSISDINGDGYRDIAYLKGGPGGALDYRLIVVSGPTPDSTGGNNLHKEEGAADDYWLDYWSPGRTVQITAISDISGDGYDDIAYLKGGSNSASDYRLVVVSGPSPAGPGGVVQQIQENAPDDYWLHHWTPGRTVQVTAISDVSGDGYDDLIYLKGGPGGPQDYRLMVVEGPSPTSPGGGNIYKHETVADDYWLDYWAPGRTVRITALRQ